MYRLGGSCNAVGLPPARKGGVDDFFGSTGFFAEFCASMATRGRGDFFFGRLPGVTGGSFGTLRGDFTRGSGDTEGLLLNEDPVGEGAYWSVPVDEYDTSVDDRSASTFNSVLSSSTPNEGRCSGVEAADNMKYDKHHVITPPRAIKQPTQRTLSKASRRKLQHT